VLGLIVGGVEKVLVYHAPVVPLTVTTLPTPLVRIYPELLQITPLTLLDPLPVSEPKKVML
jgi:hypothetical protein